MLNRTLWFLDSIINCFPVFLRKNKSFKFSQHIQTEKCNQTRQLIPKSYLHCPSLNKTSHLDFADQLHPNIFIRKFLLRFPEMSKIHLLPKTAEPLGWPAQDVIKCTDCWPTCDGWHVTNTSFTQFLSWLPMTLNWRRQLWPMRHPCTNIGVHLISDGLMVGFIIKSYY